MQTSWFECSSHHSATESDEERYPPFYGGKTILQLLSPTILEFVPISQLEECRGGSIYFLKNSSGFQENSFQDCTDDLNPLNANSLLFLNILPIGLFFFFYPYKIFLLTLSTLGPSLDYKSKRILATSLSKERLLLSFRKVQLAFGAGLLSAKAVLTLPTRLYSFRSPVFFSYGFYFFYFILL